MQKVFLEVGSLDRRCYEKFNLTEDILMENAAISIKEFICKNFKKKSKILIVSGVGNNGADGIVLARLLHKDYKISLYIPFGVKSYMAKLQLNRVNLIGIKKIKEIKKYDIVVDSLFGSGLNKALNDESVKLIERLNLLKAYKIACDIPSGIDSSGDIKNIAFKADTTITMGALKLSLFSDKTKDYVGKLIVANLGVSREIYEIDSDIYLLEKRDLKLPIREKLSTHKGDFGHINIISGEKEGASMLSALASFRFGVGLVTLISKEKKELPYHIMNSNTISKNVTSIAIGMGLGEIYSEKELEDILLNKDVPIVCDADMFYKKIILKVLKKENIVITPHPKEFISLLKLTNIANISVSELQKNRFKYAIEFSKKFPNTVLLLKGANTIITHNKIIYINNLGSNSLSKGGSGVVLSGLIASLLAQKYNTLEATLSASLAHSIASTKYKKNNYSMKPQDLIKEICKL